MAKTTLQTIADRLGVSRMTVSNAFSRPDQLSADLRRRILLAADELGYVGPDPAGRALARGTTGAVGVLLTDSLADAFTDEVATGLLRALVEELAPTGLALTLLPTGDVGVGNENAQPPGVPARDVAVDGAIVYSCHVESPARDWLLRRRLPLVFVDQDPPPGITSVNVDDRSGARAAAKHLVELGHRHVGILTVTVDGAPGLVADPAAEPLGHPQRERLLGWLEGLGRTAGNPPVVQVHHDAIHAGTGASLEAAALEGLRLLFEADDELTAVLCFSDVLALGVMGAAEELGRSVPGALSVVGFDDSPLATRVRPRLTTVRQDVAAKGRLAADALMRAIEHARSATPARAQRHLLPTELVVRDSTGPAPRPQPRGRRRPA